MADVTKHNSKQKRKGHTSKHSRINLFVGWNAVSVNYQLEGLSEIVGHYVSRRSNLSEFYLLNLHIMVLDIHVAPMNTLKLGNNLMLRQIRPKESVVQIAFFF